MFTACDDRNQNNMAWQAVEAKGIFTSVEAGKCVHVMPACSQWPADEFSVGPTINTASDDIRAGRLKKFNSIDDLIEDLNQPGD